ncbi:hypothetical protein Q5H93_13355 [Hymenobacter sp. ASUV-10]|uniref:Uncharacterized protein n=1 Tax=Hymenobacter aranciens TaxID=3063996 RepID=A0ABT9BD67_9BACT|nr:hypothetical protein [Hymenobacter sp. ASUV-10]MDO7875725.1 hypothetical protein [Hymenobacter sp. ASUV-10]
MWLLPWLTEQYVSPLPPAELLLRLQQHAAKRQALEARPVTFFLGTIGEASFKLRRNSWFNTSPLLIGRVSSDPATAGSVLWLRYRAHSVQLVLELGRLLFTLWLMIVTVRSIGASTNPVVWLFMSGFILFLVLPQLLFRREVRKYRAFLTTMLHLVPAN